LRVPSKLCFAIASHFFRSVILSRANDLLLSLLALSHNPRCPIHDAAVSRHGWETTDLLKPFVILVSLKKAQTCHPERSMLGAPQTQSVG
jgi:hypothetical protein